MTSTAFWSPKFLMRNQLLILLSCFSIAAFQILSLSLGFNTLTTTCLSVNLFEFIQLGVRETSWMYMFMSFIRFLEGFNHYFFKKFSAAFGLISSLDSHDICVVTLDGVLQVPQTLFIFFFNYFFFLLRLDNFNYLIFKFTDSSASSNLWLTLLVNFFISAPEFLLDSFLSFLLLY